MRSFDDILAEAVFQTIASNSVWRSIPTCYPTKSLYYPHALTPEEQAFAAALADATADVTSRISDQKDRWYTYAGELERTEFCFDAAKVPVTRFSDGSFPVWYGGDSAECSDSEVLYHLGRQAAHELAHTKQEMVVMFERAMCRASVLLSRGVDLRNLAPYPSGLLEDGPPYPFCNALGTRLATLEERLSGVLTRSKRHEAGAVWSVFDRKSILESRVVYYWTAEFTRERMVSFCGEPTSALQ
jgi:hypothetical protein